LIAGRSDYDCSPLHLAMFKTLYQSFCLECRGSGRVRYYSSDDPDEQELEDIMETVQIEPCPDCDGEGCLWFDKNGKQWSEMQ